MISKADFYQQAIAAPVSSAENRVFRLSVWQYASDSHKSIESDGCYRVKKIREMVFASKEEAEESILSLDCCRNDIYRFIIGEMPTEPFADGAVRNEWVYDAQGSLIDNSLASMYHLDRGKFYGRRNEQIRFKPGELVEWFDGYDTVTLGVVVGLPPTIEHCWERMKRVLVDKHFANVPNKEEAYICDFTDDCYTVIDTPDYIGSHEHVAAHYMAVPSIPVSDELRKRYAKVYKDYLQSAD